MNITWPDGSQESVSIADAPHELRSPLSVPKKFRWPKSVDESERKKWARRAAAHKKTIRDMQRVIREQKCELYDLRERVKKLQQDFATMEAMR